LRDVLDRYIERDIRKEGGTVCVRERERPIECIGRKIKATGISFH
jgi:hypothetical protein